VTLSPIFNYSLPFITQALSPFGLLCHTSPLVPAFNCRRSPSCVPEISPLLFTHSAITNFIVPALLHTLEFSGGVLQRPAFYFNWLLYPKPLLYIFLKLWNRKHCISLLLPFFTKPELELELFLRPTVSRPVRLGTGPPFGTLDQMLSCTSFFLFDSYIILISMRPLWRENGSVVYSVITH
jgi:hypothetical protein